MTQPHYIDLLPCPFCGGGAEVSNDGARPDDGYRFVRCTGVGCGQEIGWEPSADKAIAAWNRRPAVNIALPKPALAKTDGYKTADPTLLAVIRQWLNADDPTAWGPFERALDGLISGEPTKCAVCGCLSLDGKAYFPARKGAKPWPIK